MKLVFPERAWNHYLYWQEDGGVALVRLNGLIKECLHDPFRGTGKPEPLGGYLAGWWSRRINREHRLVYRVTGKADAQALEVAQCRYHY